MNLVEVRFEPPGTVVLVQPGTTLLAASAAAAVDLASGCRRGMCGTDAVRVEAPPGGLEPPGADERGTLQRMGLGAGHRLGCSARVIAGPVRVLTGDF